MLGEGFIAAGPSGEGPAAPLCPGVVARRVMVRSMVVRRVMVKRVVVK